MPHIKLDRVNGSKLRFGGHSEHFEKFNKTIRTFFADNARFLV